MGETGVGKSTFINAFVNYLLFETLDEAENGEPVVLIPVSFLMTIGDQFEECVVEFGKPDSNENHAHQGQSVTQQCKSYVFKLTNQLWLRLIDTPGMGDTRGLDQDEKNIEHILSYVNHLSHLNAVCLLFKPNDSRLNIFFRSCVNQLLTYLTPLAYNNIIFCFTNARSTFFAPGDTGPLLRRMIEKNYQNEIPFKKENTFCFDSESFRYLVARKRGVPFDEYFKQESTQSWETSVKESIRLLDFIRKQEPYDLNGYQSVRKASLEISMLARPLMETLRLSLYNWKLRQRGMTNQRIVVKSTHVESELCSNCAETRIVQVRSIYIVEHQSRKWKEAKDCVCPFNENHFLIESINQYELVSETVDCSCDELETDIQKFLFKCDRIVHFLRQKGLLNGVDPFQIVLKRFLEEERMISDKYDTNRSINGEIKEIYDYGREGTYNLEVIYDKFMNKIINELEFELNTLKDINK